MAKRWKKRPDDANWGEFGDDDQRGRMNLLTAERRLRARAAAGRGVLHHAPRPASHSS